MMQTSYLLHYGIKSGKYKLRLATASQVLVLCKYGIIGMLNAGLFIFIPTLCKWALDADQIMVLQKHEVSLQ